MEGHRTRNNGHKQGHRALGETVFTIRVVRHWNRDPERLWDVHPWRYSNLDRTCTEQPNTVGPALSEVGLETCRGPFQLKLSAVLHLCTHPHPQCSQVSFQPALAPKPLKRCSMLPDPPRRITLAVSFRTVKPFLHNSAKALTLLFQFLLR